MHSASTLAVFSNTLEMVVDAGDGPVRQKPPRPDRLWRLPAHVQAQAAGPPGADEVHVHEV